MSSMVVEASCLVAVLLQEGLLHYSVCGNTEGTPQGISQNVQIGPSSGQ